MHSDKPIKIILIFILIINFWNGLYAQDTQKQKIKLTHFLSKLSEEQQVFFHL